MEFIDLHTHTLASDGTDAPAGLVRKAAAAGLKAVAVTDHDTVGGLEEATEEGDRSGIEVIRGCEISARSEFGEMHILGLWLPEDPGPLARVLEELRTQRTDRNLIIIRKLVELGVDIAYEEVLAVAGGETVGRPHVARVLMDKGYVASLREAFERYLGYKGLAYEPKKTLSPVKAVTLLSGLGATVSLAHPRLIRCPDAWLEDTVSALKSYGLSAIEAYHSEHSGADERFCVDLAVRHGLALSGGSDYHGAAKPGIDLGTGHGGLRVPAFVLEELKRQRREHGLPV